MKLTAEDMKANGLIDDIIPEGLGGAHRNRDAVMKTVGDTLEKAIGQMAGKDGDTLRQARREKFLAMGR